MNPSAIEIKLDKMIKHLTIIKENAQRLGLESTPDSLFVSIPEQKLYHFKNNTLFKEYPASTSAKPPSCTENSFGTPNGMHRIAQKFGHNQPKGMVFVARQPTQQTFQEMSSLPTDKNLITSRILWLEGLEKGLNQGPNRDSFKRYIYIHGTHQEEKVGAPISQGCVCMKNDHVIELFDNIKENTLIWIDKEI